MFGGNNKKSRRPIGVAVTPQGVRLAQVNTTGGRYQLTASAYAPLPEGCQPSDSDYAHALSGAIHIALKQAHFTGKQAISAMPAESMHYKNIRLPKMPDAELAGAVEWEAKERIMLGEPASVQFYNAGEVRQGSDTRCEVVLLATKESAVQSHVQGITQAGLEPIAIDATGAALARVCSHEGPTTFAVHAGQSTLEVVIANQDQVLLNKLLPVGEGGFDNADPEELAREIGLCLRYHTVTFRGDKPEQVVLTGEPTPAPLADAIASALGLPVVGLEKTAGFEGNTPTDPRNSIGPWAVAAGLSMRGVAAVAKRGAA